MVVMMMLGPKVILPFYDNFLLIQYHKLSIMMIIIIIGIRVLLKEYKKWAANLFNSMNSASWILNKVAVFFGLGHISVGFFFSFLYFEARLYMYMEKIYLEIDCVDNEKKG